MRFDLRPTRDGSLTVFDREAGECYKSRHSAAAEAEHVFYRPGVLEHPAYGRQDPFRVLELGFGLGTNFLHLRKRGFVGEFVTIDRDLAGAAFFLEHEPDPDLARLMDAGTCQPSGMRARLLQQDFRAALAALSQEGFEAHAVFFDPFSPKANPEAWTESLFLLCAGLMAPGARLVTYSVSRAAKDAAARAGLRAEKRDLPPELGKRSSLLAFKVGCAWAWHLEGPARPFGS